MTEEQYRERARERLSDEDNVDDDAVVSMGDDPGAYVQVWLWVPDDDADDGDDECAYWGPGRDNYGSLE